MAKDNAPPIPWRKGELIGCGAFSRVYMGINLGSGELLAVKQLLIAANGSPREKAQAHIKEIEEEVKILKKLSHPNIVRYLGTVREEETFNILLEFVPGGSILSLLGKFGSFPEAVVRRYTKQLLLGLAYLHKNGITHKDIKGANILVDNKGCIKLADFCFAELAIKSSAPEVIIRMGHSFSADIWSVGCTVIEMATGKPYRSQQFQEVAALFHIRTTKSHPLIPEHLSDEAKDFLLKCLQREPNLRPAASELLQHPFVTGKPPPSPSKTKGLETFKMSTCLETADVCNLDSLNCSTVSDEKSFENRHLWRKNSSDDEMCQIGDSNDMTMGEGRISSLLMPVNFKSFNPMSEPSDDWVCKLDISPETENEGIDLHAGCSETFNDRDKKNSFPFGTSLAEDDEEVLTELKIRAFLDEKVLELKKLQMPLDEEFYNSMSGTCSPSYVESTCDEITPLYLKLPPRSRSRRRRPVGTPSEALDTCITENFGSNEMMSQEGLGGKTSSPKDRAISRQRAFTRFASPRRFWWCISMLLAVTILLVATYYKKIANEASPSGKSKQHYYLEMYFTPNVNANSFPHIPLFTIHGYWPPQTNGKAKVLFEKELLKDGLLEVDGEIYDLHTYWPSLNKKTKDMKLWMHEFNKHGQYFKGTQEEYFQLTVRLYMSLDLDNAFKSLGIEAGTKCKRETIISKLQKIRNFRCILICGRKGDRYVLLGVRFCFANEDGITLEDCSDVVINELCEDDFIY